LAYVQIGQYSKALQDFNEMLRLQPTDPLAWYKRGVALNLAGRPQQAASSFLTALRYRPRLAEAHRGLADAFARMGRQNEAALHLEMANSLPADAGLSRP
jgi:tetratricopeptide (TPR) repeat protein